MLKHGSEPVQAAIVNNTSLAIKVFLRNVLLIGYNGWDSRFSQEYKRDDDGSTIGHHGARWTVPGLAWFTGST